ncbi:MAG: TAT-variant-translocated molybdopterin oxidoreductase [Phycisphaeraceae bacterium]
MSQAQLDQSVDLEALRAKLAGKQGRQYWRSLEELAQTPEFRAYVDNEFAAGAPEWDDRFSRRSFLQIMGASLALAGLSAGCTRQPEEKIVPYVKQPEYVVPGKPMYFATSDVLAGYGRGLLVQSNDGRPTKIDGNPDHPASPGPFAPQKAGMTFGAADIYAIASILGMYDPDRSQAVKYLGEYNTWTAFTTVMSNAAEKIGTQQGQGLYLLTETVTSPTLIAQMQALLAKYPKAVWTQHEPVNRDQSRQGAMLAFGEDAQAVYHFDRAARIVAVDSDFVTTGPASVRQAHDFAAGRRVRAGIAAGEMNRLYAVESTLTSTGATADHRLALSPAEIDRFVRLLAAKLGISVGQVEPGAVDAEFVEVVAQDLAEHAGRGLVITGEGQPAHVHALVHAINEKLGNHGPNRPIEFIEPVAASLDQGQSLRDLVKAIDQNLVETLIVLGGNPVYNAPADLSFKAHYEKVQTRIHLGLYEDETAALSHWHIPQAHLLESWSDARSVDGTVGIIQPLIAPLYNGKTAHDLLTVLLGEGGRNGQRLVQDYWKTQISGAEFEKAWRKALHDGVVPGTQRAAKAVTAKAAVDLPRLSAARAANDQVDIILRPDPSVWDGRFANNGWLQELPRPITKLTWDNALLVSPATARDLGAKNGDVLDLTSGAYRLAAPVFITPGHADGCMTLHLGYGRMRAGHVGTNVGANAYALRQTDQPWVVRDVKVAHTGRTHQLVDSQKHHSMENRDLVRGGTLDEFLHNPASIAKSHHEDNLHLSLYEPYKFTGTQWAMTIDLTACIGCNACTIACQSENNIPVVGKAQVAVGREMHWIRVDHYYSNDANHPDPNQPESEFQPVTCMHCENAPCEVVCPVGATQHSDDGLNDMVYNRCIGTRYCSNNCPYKVRRFNFLEYQRPVAESLQLMQNPNVTVRMRGVMEKCTYCVQRISAARIGAKKRGITDPSISAGGDEDYNILDGEVVTACQAACPTQAIIFGNMNDPSSQVAQSRLPHQPHNYGMLTELNTRPRTTYLARVRNVHPKLAAATHEEHY